MASRSIDRPWRIVRIKSVTQEMIDRQMETARRCADLQLGVDVRLRLRGQGDIYVRQHDLTSWWTRVGNGPLISSLRWSPLVKAAPVLWCEIKCCTTSISRFDGEKIANSPVRLLNRVRLRLIQRNVSKVERKVDWKGQVTGRLVSLIVSIIWSSNRIWYFERIDYRDIKDRRVGDFWDEKRIAHCEIYFPKIV